MSGGKRVGFGSKNSAQTRPYKQFGFSGLPEADPKSAAPARTRLENKPGRSGSGQHFPNSCPNPPHNPSGLGSPPGHPSNRQPPASIKTVHTPTRAYQPTHCSHQEIHSSTLTCLAIVVPGYCNLTTSSSNTLSAS
ncbi:hypothetical protein PGT21_035740 [Puccinia graminis f. sp. tritici]|uniref:Uncharacterized protein n=1 Tax=Puccinia graminis f. sp. tritici TaxID=56615 RepID=A0A5B0NIJ9_PUCGR|nr:hypothetical protein PGT21_035740 [Puccinia graminis f. sp. tritici]